MVNFFLRSRLVVANSAILSVLLGPMAYAGDAPGPSPYGTLVRRDFSTRPPPESMPLERGLIDQDTAAGSRHPLETPPQSITNNDRQGAADSIAALIFAVPTLFADERTSGGAFVKEETRGPQADVVFAAPAYPPDRGGTDASFLDERPLGQTADVIFAAPLVSMVLLKGVEANPAAVAVTSAPLFSARDAASASAATISHDALQPRSVKIADLKRQARERWASGSIAATRALLAQAVAEGDAEAQYMLARTFDSDELAHDGAVGVAADPARAADLYRLAQAGGYPIPDLDTRAKRPE